MSEHNNSVSNPNANGNGSGDNVGQSEEILELREKLRLLKEIQDIQSRIHQPITQQPDLAPSRTQPVMRVKPPEGLYTMSAADYRSYMKDCRAYQELTNLSDHQIVLQLRLSMDLDLKRVIDTNYPEWD